MWIFLQKLKITPEEKCDLLTEAISETFMKMIFCTCINTEYFLCILKDANMTEAGAQTSSYI